MTRIPSDWQPIDTAPRDGTIVELTDGDMTFAMRWSATQRNPFFAPGVTGMWVVPNGSMTWTEHDPDGAPTHWRPCGAGRLN